MLPLIYHPIYSDFPLPDGHRYPLQKYRLLKEYIEQQHLDVALLTPEKLDGDIVKSIHDTEYADALLNGTLPLAKMRRIGFPWSEALIERSLTSLGGTLLTMEQAYKQGLAIHLTGGYHHSHYDFGSGFCLFNDLVLGAQHILSTTHARKVMIIDCDVHHGDGTAAMAQGRDDIVTVSVHCEKNFPSRKPESDLDLGLPNDTGTDEYLSEFFPLLDIALAQHQPDFVIYDAGVDIHKDDELGYLNVCLDGIYRRDFGVLTRCRNLDIPVAAVIGGGYRTDHSALVPLHFQLIKAAMAAKE